MSVSRPHLSPRVLLSTNPPDRSVIDRHQDGTAGVLECRLVTSGKHALATTLARIDRDSPSDNVLIPALVTDGVVRAVEAAGFTPNFYRVRPDLGADCPDLRERVDDATVAILAVHYFGFLQPNIEGLREIAHDTDTYLLVDNAHSPLSSADSGPLATMDDAGFTSLHKQFPVPDGAVMTVSHPDLAATTDQPDAVAVSSGRASFPRGGRFCVDSMARYVTGRTRRVRATVGRVTVGETPIRTDGGNDTPTPGDLVNRRGVRPDPNPNPDPEPDPDPTSADDPAAITRYLVTRIHPRRVIENRRQNYEFWLDSLADSVTPDLVYPTLPDGICPQVFPVLVGDPARFCRTVVGRSTPTSTWPPLPTSVRGDPEFPVANRLANRLVRLPVHQGLDVRDLAPTVSSVQRFRARPGLGGD